MSTLAATEVRQVIAARAAGVHAEGKVDAMLEALAQLLESPPGTVILACDGEAGCCAPVTHIDNKGYIYCEGHGLARRTYRPCRKLRPHELRTLRRGEPVRRY